MVSVPAHKASYTELIILNAVENIGIDGMSDISILFLLGGERIQSVTDTMGFEYTMDYFNGNLSGSESDDFKEEFCNLTDVKIYGELVELYTWFTDVKYQHEDLRMEVGVCVRIEIK